MKNDTTLLRRIFRKIIGGISLGSALFVFQACYGIPNDEIGLTVKGIVTSESSKEPIMGIKVELDIEEQSPQYTYTDVNGYFGFYLPRISQTNLSFTDVDSIENGSYVRKDTLVELPKYGVIHLDIELQEVE